MIASIIVLVTTFGVNGGNVTNVQIMPNMQICQRILKFHTKEWPRPESWSTTEVRKPRYAECKELKE